MKAGEVQLSGPVENRKHDPYCGPHRFTLVQLSMAPATGGVKDEDPSFSVVKVSFVACWLLKRPQNHSSALKSVSRARKIVVRQVPKLLTGDWVPNQHSVRP